MADPRNSDTLPLDSSPLMRSRNITRHRLLDDKNLETRSDGVLYCSAGASSHSKNSQMRNDASSSVRNLDAIDIVAGDITEYVKCILQPIFSKFAPSTQNPQASATDEETELFNCVCKCHQQIVSKESSASSDIDWQSRSLYFDASHLQQVIRNCLHDITPETVPNSRVFNYPTPNFAQELVSQIPGPLGEGQSVSEDCSQHQQTLQNRSAEKNTLKVAVDNVESSTPIIENITGVHQPEIYNRSAVENTPDVVTDNLESSNPTLERNTPEVTGEPSNPASGNITGVLNTLPGTSEEMKVQGYVQLTCCLCRKNYYDVTSQGSRLMFSKCGHVFCRLCTKKLIRKRESCPTCNRRMDHRGVYKILL